MMRIAIAGGGGFAYILVGEVTQTANAVLVLSTRQHPELETLGAQVAVVDFANVEELRYALQGVDLVISTIPGQPQLNLIDAAHLARVRTFVPSEFEGALARRPQASDGDPLDRGSAMALERLRELSQPQQDYQYHHQHHQLQAHPPPAPYPMSFTAFSCGVLYERLAPGGLAAFNIGAGQTLTGQGDYLADVGNATAEIVESNAQGGAVLVSMTSVFDVARFVAAAVEIGPERWPSEFRMRGDHLSVRDIVGAAINVRGVPFNLTNHQYGDLQSHLEYAIETSNWRRWCYLQQLLATADGRYALGRPNLNELVDEAPGVSVVPERFADWLRRSWGQPQPQPQIQPHFQATVMEIG
ncbi:isoflavone reductase [Diaporthe helianthi]|uniref:Isoflavone reductase n=1 Tax=Diaporthe helianthi TaxID=158607 RepID=A0A2P5IBZ9_DIAHE|nr:isoflavone reductase [Diaporthe helianthi]